MDRTITYNTIGGDMDLNSSGDIDQTNEYAGLRSENEGLKDAPDFIATRIVNIMYQTLSNTRSVNITTRQQCVPFTNICRTIATLTSVPTSSALGNDGLVTIPSSQGQGGFSRLITNTSTFNGTNGRDHSTIANRGISQTVLPWLIQIDRSKGGLK